MSPIGNKINQYRKEKNYTQEKLAEQIGVDIKTISRWERDENTPSTDVLKKIAEVLEVPVSYLIDDHKMDSQKSNKEEKATRKKNSRIMKKIIFTISIIIIFASAIFITHKLTKNYYDIVCYEFISENKDIGVSGTLFRNKKKNAIRIDDIVYYNEEAPRGTINAIKTSHVTVELLSNSKIMVSETFDYDEKKYLYDVLADYHLYLDIFDDAKEDYKGFDYKDITIRIFYGLNESIETNLILKEIKG